MVLTGAPFDFFAMLGLLSLAGVIINNGIVLIDKIDSDRAGGMSPYQAVLSAAISRFCSPISRISRHSWRGSIPR